jgi:hypothetical protein
VCFQCVNEISLVNFPRIFRLPHKLYEHLQRTVPLLYVAPPHNRCAFDLHSIRISRKFALCVIEIVRFVYGGIACVRIAGCVCVIDRSVVAHCVCELRVCEYCCVLRAIDGAGSALRNRFRSRRSIDGEFLLILN